MQDRLPTVGWEGERGSREMGWEDGVLWVGEGAKW